MNILGCKIRKIGFLEDKRIIGIGRTLVRKRITYNKLSCSKFMDPIRN